MTFAGISQLVTLVPDLNPTFWKRLLITWGATIAYVGYFLLVSIKIAFPIPFMWYVGGVLMGIYVPVMQFIVFGVAPFRKTSPCYRNLQRHMNDFTGFVVLMNIFPIYKVLYGFVPVPYHGIAVIILPIWKLAAKHFMVKATRDMEDYIPGNVAMTVDFYSALFVSVCMWTKGSMYLSVFCIAADIGQAFLEYREVQKNAKTVFELLRARHASSERFSRNSSKRWSSTTLSNILETSKLVNLILEVTPDPHAFHVESLKGVRLRACYSHRLDPGQQERLDTLEALNVYCALDYISITPAKLVRYKRRYHCFLNRRARAAIVPKSMHIEEAIVPTFGVTDEGSLSDLSSPVEIFNATLKHTAALGEKSGKLVEQGLQLLFHCEYLILVEYIECVVPLVFILYKVVLEHLPNVAYYPGGAGNFGFTAIANILVFAMLEVGSLIFLQFFVNRKFGLSSIYQLAFVLEAQSYLVQGSLFVESLFLLQYELEHFGKCSPVVINLRTLLS
ncbi:unnamed protein product [Phytophthora lilii]|uniref:Unnamed protein product n=1 Tax=Phytophthora lilii TaxID=2077276 RepID=A0A9W7CRA7_9STRA|nr:unnamed protein product [Phytophthora lilii]